MYVSKDKYLCKVHTCIKKNLIALNTSKTNKNRKTTEIIDKIVALVHLFIIVYRV